MIDRMWYEWQLSDPQNANSFSGGSGQCVGSMEQYEQYPSGCPLDLDVSACSSRFKEVRFDLILKLNSTLPTDGLFPQLTIGDVMNTTGGVLCYVYQ
jgi:tyrosinase